MEKMNAEKLNWDNNFSVRFKLENGKSLKHIPSNIFQVTMPEISVTDISSETMKKSIGIVLRSTQDGSVEKEVYDELFTAIFDVELSLSNPNKVDYVYKKCSVEKISFAPLMNRPNANPFNFTLWLTTDQIIYKGASEDITFGNDSDKPVFRSLTLG